MHYQNSTDWYEIYDGKSILKFTDWSTLLDVPAGKHGFVNVSEAELRFEDGKPARFLGINLVGSNCFPSNDDAQKIAIELSAMGCNLVRLHHMDATWAYPNIFGNKGTTRSLDPDNLALLDYLIHLLKQKGIYVYIDLLVHRCFTPADGIAAVVEEGGKQAAFFDPVLITLQKEYAQQLFCHRNPFTGMDYKDDPVIIGTCIINEASVFAGYDGDQLTDYYRQQLEQKFKSQYPGKKLAFFTIDYRYTEGGLNEKEDGDITESIQFLTQIEIEFYKEMKAFLLEIGVKCLISGSNYPRPILTDIYANADNDISIANAYWDHPKVHQINNDWGRIIEAPIDNSSQLKASAKNMVVNFSRFRIYDKPFLITEWAQPFPNEYRLEAFPFLACYGMLQGWSGICQFDYELQRVPGKPLSTFNIGSMPDSIAQWSILAPLFHKKYLREAPSYVVDSVTDDMLQQLPAYSDFNERYSFLSFITRTGKSFSGKSGKERSEFMSFINTASGEITSETNELVFSPKKNFFKISTTAVQGMVGKIPAGIISFPFFTIDLYSPAFASIIALAEDDKPLAESESILLSLISEVVMTDQKYDPSEKKITRRGEFPMLAKKIKGIIQIHSSHTYTLEYLYICSTKVNRREPLISNNILLHNIDTLLVRLIKD